MEHDLPRHLFFSLINAPSRKKVKKIINARNNSYRAYGTPINNLMLLFIMHWSFQAEASGLSILLFDFT